MTKAGWCVILASGAILGTSACISRSVAMEHLTVGPGDSRTIQMPVKAQLRDGSIGVFAPGLVVDQGEIRGSGWRYAPTLRDSTALTHITLDSVVSLDAISTRVNKGRSFVNFLLGSAGIAALALATALGICLATPSCRLM